MSNLKRRLSYFGPGFIVAATGVGAGDLIAASVAGARYGTVILWAALLGGLLKFALNEGVARWQLATGETLLEGWIKYLPKWVSYYFLVYLLLWSFVVAGALISFCGLAAQTLLPIHPDESTGTFIWGAIQSGLAVALVLAGSYRLLERLMKGFIGLMFVVVISSAWGLAVDWGDILTALVFPKLPDDPEAVFITLGLIGGVGGSVTLLSYAYWLAEKGWTKPRFLNHARIDLGIAYTLTSLFGIALIIIAAGASPERMEGYGMILSLADQLSTVTGPIGRWGFLIGFWGAVFSSMLGVWDGVPYLFADFVRTFSGKPVKQQLLRPTLPYRLFLGFLAVPPLAIVCWSKPAWIGILYAVTGAFFMPFLAALLLYMNNYPAWTGTSRNGWLANIGLALSLLLFLALFFIQIT
ncbi:MAG: Nramp family divalent metal transporter [Phaeodactylibacter sp.]|uniref:Nramp family divalent metal transporter n=1 Tax=Phaeodactylibacter sp. TaxID=1940289 RepID=UPI0032EE6921